MKQVFPEFFHQASVLEIGSAYVNGSIRELFTECAYTGVDLSPGNGVDVVSSGHTFDPVPPKVFDLAISCECFEHNPHYAETLRNMIRLTASDGLVVFTCASTGRPEHGTSRTDGTLSPGTTAVGWDYYRNLEAHDFAEVAASEELAFHVFFNNDASSDLYFVGAKSQQAASRLKAEAPFLAQMASFCQEATRSWSRGEVSARLPADAAICPELLKYYRNNNQKAGNELLDAFFWLRVMETRDMYPDDHFALYVAYLHYTNLGRRIEALRTITRAVELCPGAEDYRTAHIWALKNVDRADEALELVRALSRETTKLGPWILYLELLIASGKLEEAAEAVDTALENHPDLPQFLVRKANILKKLGASYEAAEIYALLLSEEFNAPAQIRDIAAKALGSTQ